MSLRIVAVVALLFLLASCAKEPRMLDIQQKTELLEQPYPLGYPSTSPMPNSVLRVLEPQKVTVLSDSFEKDFHVYRVRDASGVEGWVIGKSGITEEK